MKIGDIVVPKTNEPLLYCGTGIYKCAIVANLDPFVLVSMEGDMLWGDINKDDVEALGKAYPQNKKIAIKRWNKFRKNEGKAIMKKKEKKNGRKCVECGKPATHIRCTQFAGDHPYCTKCAKKEKDYNAMGKI